MMFSLFLFLIQFSVQSQTPSNYLVRNYTVEDGLPVNSINDIVQDSSGYLYFTTYDGLVRYDGYDFKVFNSSNTKGILNDRFAGMILASSGTIWLISESGIITSFKKNKFRNYPIQNGAFGNISSLIEDHNQAIWIASQNGISYLTPSDTVFTPFINEHVSINVSALSATQEGTILGIAEEGLFEIKGDSVDILLSKNQIPFDLRGSLITKKLTNGYIYLINMNGVIAYDPKSKKIINLLNTKTTNISAWNIYEIKAGIILSTSLGYYLVDKSTQTLKKLPISVPNVMNRPNTFIKKNNDEYVFGNQVVLNGEPIFQTEEVKTGFIDSEQSIWVSSSTKGLYQIRKSVITNVNTTHSTNIENTYSVIQATDGSIWTASIRGGVYRITKNSVQNWNENNSALSTNHALNLFQDSDGSIYLSMEVSGLWKFKNNDWERIQQIQPLLESTETTIKAMFRAKNKFLFIGSNQNTFVRIGEEYKKLEDVYGFSFNGVRVIKQAQNEFIYFGTNGNGLGILKPDSSFSILNTENGLPSNFIRDVFIQSNDTVWIATENKGLARLLFDQNDSLKSIVSITSANGLADNSLHHIIQDAKQNLWISSNSGIMSISMQNLNRYADRSTSNLQVTRFNQRDGMLNQEANGGVQSAGLLSNDNKIWFPNQIGITIIDLNNIDLKKSIGKISPLIESIKTSDSLFKNVDNSPITLPLGKRNFSVKFTAPNFAHPERISFFYQLSGINDSWVKANQSKEAYFTNLNTGIYHFRLQVELTDGSTNSTSLSIIIPPFFHETILFRFLVLLIFVALVYFGVQLRTNQLKKREKELERRVKEQTIALEEAAEVKSRFFSGITHELKTPLSLILAPLDDYIEQNTSEAAEKLHQHLSLIHRNGYRLKNLVDQILDVSKLNADAIQLAIQPVDIVSLTNQIIGQFQSLLEQNGITLEVQSENLQELIYVDKDAWERIILNLVSNAIKYSPENSKIVLYYENHPNSISLHVKDYGRGISEENQEKIFDYLFQVNQSKTVEGTGIGLFLVKGLVERVGGSISIKSKLGEGSEFIVELQKGFIHFKAEDILSHRPLVIQPKPVLAPISSVAEQAPIQTEITLETKQRILLVEDNNDFRMYLKSLLETEYEIHTAKNGKKGLKYIVQNQVDLIISDIMMPEMGGLEFIQNVRQIDRFKHIPVVFLSAKSQEADIQQGLSTGADVYLTKPIRSSTLLSQVQAILRRERILNGDIYFGKSTSTEPELIAKSREIIFRQLANPILNIDFIAANLFMSRTNLYRSWKQVSDVSISDFIKKIRFEEALVLINEKGFSIQNAANAVGFSDPNYFSTSFKKHMGFPPSEIKK